jgi:hypothetical protein
MAMELLVLGTVTGGSGELLVNERTGWFLRLAILSHWQPN